MGAALSNVIKSIDSTNDSGQQAIESLSALRALGESRDDVAWDKAETLGAGDHAPILKKLMRSQSIVTDASSSNDQIASGIKRVTGNTVKGQILDGLTDIIANALSTVLNDSAQVSSKHFYALIATSSGALLRVDIDIHSYNLRSKRLQQYAENVVTFTSIISTIDMTYLTLADLKSIVSTTYTSSPEERQKAIFDLVKAAWENDLKLNGGGDLDDAERDRSRALIRPSEYEKQAASPAA
ncbi:hypothetical protein CB0940_00351 [Cercospora beticola]|uniref:Uncharacterized protein n=1 Tax=Cercospora beticola TaxID=122368 RepID=A0A2G5I6F2_CERBT|nr:hypothetical protein CB0940_00351 [Cercospora beticola]PIB00406.1 hypothetical protein CB0940_00351 [Cercospora beticola]WPA95764.1 hypothetical protein RHO25_000367 [Cercospora beticola]CAK1355984.1 unnamed protein product [Cercospora beticola]